MEKYNNSIPQCVENKLVFDVDAFDDIKKRMIRYDKKIKDLSLEDLEELMKMFHTCENLKLLIKEKCRKKLSRYKKFNKPITIQTRAVFIVEELVYFAHNRNEVEVIKSNVLDPWSGYESSFVIAK